MTGCGRAISGKMKLSKVVERPSNGYYFTRTHHATVECASARADPRAKKQRRTADAEVGESHPYPGMGAYRGIHRCVVVCCGPPHERAWLANAFVAKAVLGLDRTAALIERPTIDRALRRICGFPMCRKLPSELTFSRAFDESAAGTLAERVHEALIQAHLGDQLIGHISRYGTAIVARERPKRAQAETPEALAPSRSARDPDQGGGAHHAGAGEAAGSFARGSFVLGR